jgi:S-DNA-T family DNA segregation ATPase FtsK/SpoIIIE
VTRRRRHRGGISATGRRSEEASRALREAVFWLGGAIALIVFLSLLTYHRHDPSWFYASARPVRNLTGTLGADVSAALYFFAGVSALLFPPLAFVLLVALHRSPLVVPRRALALRALAAVVALACLSALATLLLPHTPSFGLGTTSGGLGGIAVCGLLRPALGILGSALLLTGLLLASATLATRVSWIGLGRGLRAALAGLASRLLLRWRQSRKARRTERELPWRRVQDPLPEEAAIVDPAAEDDGDEPPPPRPPPLVRTVSAPPPEPSPRALRERQGRLFERAGADALPPLSLLDEAPARPQHADRQALEAMSRLVEDKLSDFGVKVQVVAVEQGPVVTRLELQPAPGVKVSQIATLSKDLARTLSTTSVRVVDIIPGKPFIGLEVPNANRELVTLGEILRTRLYADSPSPLTLALGKDIAGQPVVADLERMPHLLIAGTTGAGKSVALNAMILSLLYKNTSERVRLVLIDPKMLELSAYADIPHLLTPVVTDVREAATALRWAVREMDRRYRLMAALGVRGLAGYRRRLEEGPAETTAEVRALLTELGYPAPETLPVLPQVVIVIDELADLMLVAGKKVEQLVARLAQKARASGLHLILATQRPTVDVITGLIKANVPARVAFQVSSRTDSRTILDQNGAESLLGQGDMLYLPAGQSVPLRVHGAFVSDNEVHRVVDHLRKTAPAQYHEEILRERETSDDGDVDPLAAEDGGGGGSDPLYDEAVRLVLASKRASTSAVQRRLRIGYNRAARLIERMEREGLVGPLQSNGMREVLVSRPEEDR